MSISTFSPCVHSLCLNHYKRAHRQPRDASCAARRRGRYISQSHTRRRRGPPRALGGGRESGDRRQPTDADRERSKSPRPPADLVPPRARCACVNVCSISRMYNWNPRGTQTHSSRTTCHYAYTTHRSARALAADCDSRWPRHPTTVRRGGRGRQRRESGGTRGGELGGEHPHAAACGGGGCSGGGEDSGDEDAAAGEAATGSAATSRTLTPLPPPPLLPVPPLLLCCCRRRCCSYCRRCCRAAAAGIGGGGRRCNQRSRCSP